MATVPAVSAPACVRVASKPSRTSSALAAGAISAKVSSISRPTLSVWTDAETPTRAMASGTIPMTN